MKQETIRERVAALQSLVESVLREYGPMTVSELELATDSSRERVATVIRKSRNVKRVTSVPPVKYAYREDR